jgi:hypothetical protein
MKFGQIHRNLLLFFSFLSLLFANLTNTNPSWLSSLPLSYSLCLMHLDTREGGSPRQSCQDHTPPLSLTPALSNPQPASSSRPGEHQDPTCKPLTSPTSPLLSLEAQGHPVHAHADQGAEGKPAPATTPPGCPLAAVVDAQWLAAAHAARWPSSSPRSVPSHACSGCREWHSHSEACTHLFPARCMSPSMASKPQRHATLAQHARPPEPPGRDTKMLHVN